MGINRRQFSLRVLLASQLVLAVILMLGFGAWQYYDPYRLAAKLSDAGALVRPKEAFSYGPHGNFSVQGLSTQTKYRLRPEEVAGVFVPHGNWDKSAALPLFQEFPHLEVVGLSNTNVDDGDVQVLSQLDSVQFLDLEGTLITDAALTTLETRDSLRILAIRNTNVTRAGIERFQKVRPDVELVLYIR